MAGTNQSSLPLQQLISTLDTSRLPVVLQVCSGIYFQGSIYEMSGSEVCLSTGDLLKVTSLKLLSITCEDATSNQKAELPINHKGLFKQVPGRRYRSLEEMLHGRVLVVGDPHLPFVFFSRCELTPDPALVVVGAGTVMEAFAVEPGGAAGEARMWCRVSGSHGGSVVVVLPLCCQGEFSRCFSLQDIVSSAQLLSGRFCPMEAADGAGQALVIHPVYDVEAYMQLRKDVVRFPSSLEVDVVEVTDQSGDTLFIAPHSLDELLPLPDHTFPAMARIMEAPKVEHLVCSGWVEELCRHKELVLLGTGSVTMALFSSARKTRRQYFLVSEHYSGRFRRRPREFRSVFEVYVAATQAPGLRVTVTQLGQETEDDVPGLVAGEELEVVGFQTPDQEARPPSPNHNTDVLICRRIEELSEDEEEEGALSPPTISSATLVLPLHMHGVFREVITNKKKYRIKDLCQQFSLPLDVKVSNQDGDLNPDPLYGISSLCLEGVTTETVVQASFTTSPELSFAIPTRWLSMVIYFTQKSLPWPRGEPPVAHVDTVTEVTESFYLENFKLIYSQKPPPPRPPKNNLSSTRKVLPKSPKPVPLAESFPALSANSSTSEDGLSNLSIACKSRTLPLAQIPRKRIPPTPPHKSSASLPSPKLQVSPGEVQSGDSDDDYETIDLDTIKKMHEYILY